MAQNTKWRSLIYNCQALVQVRVQALVPTKLLSTAWPYHDKIHFPSLISYYSPCHQHDTSVKVLTRSQQRILGKHYGSYTSTSFFWFFHSLPSWILKNDGFGQRGLLQPVWGCRAGGYSCGLPTFETRLFQKLKNNDVNQTPSRFQILA